MLSRDPADSAVRPGDYWSSFALLHSFYHPNVLFFTINPFLTMAFLVTLPVATLLLWLSSARAANDWGVPCLSGQCSFDLANHTASGSLHIVRLYLVICISTLIRLFRLGHLMLYQT